MPGFCLCIYTQHCDAQRSMQCKEKSSLSQSHGRVQVGADSRQRAAAGRLLLEITNMHDMPQALGNLMQQRSSSSAACLACLTAQLSCLSHAPARQVNRPC